MRVVGGAEQGKGGCGTPALSNHVREAGLSPGRSDVVQLPEGVAGELGWGRVGGYREWGWRGLGLYLLSGSHRLASYAPYVSEIT